MSRQTIFTEMQPTDNGIRTYKNYYKDGIGIVKCVSNADGLTEYLRNHKSYYSYVDKAKELLK